MTDEIVDEEITDEVETAEELEEEKRRLDIARKQLELDKIALEDEKQAVKDAQLDKVQATPEQFIGKQELKNGQPFTDVYGVQHSGNCNSHPAKKIKGPCDCKFEEKRAIARAKRLGR